MIAIDHLSVFSKHESDQRLHGLSGVGTYYPCSGWHLGGSKTHLRGFYSSLASFPSFFFF